MALLIPMAGAIAQPTQSSTPVRVGIYQNSPKIFLDGSGQPSGFWVDVLDEIATAEDWTVEYVPCEWATCLQAVEETDLDLMVDVAYSEDRDRRFDFNQEAVLSSWSVVYTHPDIEIDSVLELDQLRVGVLEASIQYAALLERVETLNIQPEFVQFDNFETLLADLDQGTLEAGVVNRFIGQKAESEYDIAATNILVYPSQLYFVTAEGQNATLLNRIDQHLQLLKADRSSAYYQAERRWLSPPRPSLYHLLRHALWDVLIFIPVMGIVAFAVWNWSLRQEVQQRKQAEQRFQTLANNMPGVIFRYLLTSNGAETFVYISSRCEQLWGIPAERVMSNQDCWWELVHPEHQTHLRDSFLRSARTLTLWNVEWLMTTPDERLIWLQVSANPQRQASGDIIWDGLIFDVTERRKTETALRESEGRFQQLARNLPGILYGYRLRPDGSDAFTYISSGFEDVYGLPPDAALQDSEVVWRMTHPDDVAMVKRTVVESHQTMQVWQAQYRVVLPNRQIKWLQGIARPSQQANGDVIWDGLIIDISDRKHIEEALRKSEQRFRNTAANIPGAIFQYVLHVDGTDHVNFMSQGCFDLWEVPAEQAQQNVQLLWQMVHPDDLRAMQNSVLESARTLQPWSWEWKITTPSGKVKWLAAAGSPERQPNGDVVWDSLAMDVSDRKQAEIALQTSESRLTTLIGNLPGFVYRAANNRDYTVEYISPGVSDITEYRPADYLETGITSLGEQIHSHDRARVWNVVQQALRQQRPYECEHRLVTRSGKTKWVWVRGRGIFSATGHLHHLEGFVTDISDRKYAELALQESEVRYRQVVEAQTDFILRSLPDTTITFANDALCTALGVRLEEVVGKKWVEFANPDDLQRQAFQQLARLTPQNPRCFVENRDTRASGQIGWTQWLNEGVFDETGQLVEIQSVGRDITQLKQVEQALRNSEERLRLVTENMSDLVCLHHIDGHFTYATPSSQTLVGYDAAELIGQDPYLFIHPDDRESVRRQLHSSALEGRSSGHIYRMRHKAGHYIWLETLVQPVFDERGHVSHLQTTSRNVSDRVRVEQQLKHDALHDSLTRLPNRARLMCRLERALEQVKQQAAFQFAVLFLDLDNFKVVNDSLGHLVGDELLRQVADQLRQFIRDTDLAARLGGDEFVILVEEINSINEAVNVAERILASLRSPFSVADRDVFISTSIGIVAGNTNYQRAVDLLRDADLAMYYAKHNGRAQYALFDPTMHLHVVQRLHLEQDLRKALEREDLELYYQPIVSLKTLKIVGFEALLRWHHPQHGFISPQEFIPIAEETGLIVSMGQWLLHAACQQLATWQAQFPQQSLKISVNLSVQQLQPSLLMQLENAIAASRIVPSSLVLELTESMLAENIASTQTLLNQLKSLDVRLSIDDFGTGYSSLSYLSRLPMDNLKIDRAFVNPPESDTRNQVIAESIIALSNLLELSVTAEGIETKAQLQWLRKLGCQEGQGYLFSAPVPPAQAAHMLTQSLFQALR